MASRWTLYDPAEEFGASWPREVYSYRAGAQGGLLGGLSMIVVALIYGVISGKGIWLPVNLLGATIVRDLQDASLATLGQLNVLALIAGLAIHIGISTVIGLVYALLLPTLPGHPLIWAMLVGPLLWALGLMMLPLINPVMQRHIEPISFGIAHILYGLVLGSWMAHTPKQPVVE